MRMTSLLRRFKPYLPVLPLLMLGWWNAVGNRFIQDDAYISYNYAKWFSRGYRLVWYPGSTEFGFTNFLYSLWIGLGMVVGFEPETISNAINVASFTGCLLVTYAMGMRLFQRRLPALCAVLLLATHHSFTSYASGGLETMWVTLLVLLFYWHILTRKERPGYRTYPRLGILAALALLSRLDSALLLFPGYVFLLLAGMQQPTLRAMIAQLLRIREAVIIPLLATLVFLLCCYLAYGHALPNSFNIKMPGSSDMITIGLHYLWLYTMLHAYLPLLVPLVILYFTFRKDSLARIGCFTLLMAAVIGLWLAYIVFVGGDFMEFRFLVPVLPFYYLIVFRLILTLLTRRRGTLIALITLLFLGGNALHPTLFATTPDMWDLPNRPKPFHYSYVETTESLNDWLRLPSINWRQVGKGLNRLFAFSDVKLSTTAIGAITYYSDMNTIDLLGLNTRAVNSEHEFFLPRPGHQMRASGALLDSLSVNLNLSHPEALCKQGLNYTAMRSVNVSFHDTRHETLLIPLNNSCYVVADYLKPHPRVEELLKDKVILRFREVGQYSNCPAWLCLR